MTSTLSREPVTEGATSPAVLITSDAHVGPRMVEDLRPYCPKEHLEDFDAFVADIASVRQWWAESGAPGLDPGTGHYDSDVRVKDLERDGYVGEVVFHFSFNGEMIPFVPMLASSDKPTDLSLAYMGLHIYNQWLADFCAKNPGRIGLAYLPYWDLDLAVKEVEWAAEHGLRGLNFPAMRENILPYDDPAYENLWAAAAANEMPLTTHAGAVSPSSQTHEYLAMLEAGGAPNRRAIHRMIFAGIFERYPKLKLVMTEQPGLWQKPLMDEMDSVYRACTNPNRGGMSVLSKKQRKMEAPSKWKGYAVNTIPLKPLEKLPSEYFLSNIFTGASYMSHMEAAEAIEHGYTDTIMYGTDYPHPEGSWKQPESEDEESQVIRALQVTYEGLNPDRIREMVGLNAARCYGLDISALQKRAQEINAPSPAQLAQPTTGPRVGIGGTGGMAFRTQGTWF